MPRHGQERQIIQTRPGKIMFSKGKQTFQTRTGLKCGLPIIPTRRHFIHNTGKNLSTEMRAYRPASRQSFSID
ncbi:hypothetical protein NEILACOT_03836 [Neisseria lactamica ATCC 23970]|uniref:Uncharacterized protein n=1 Tax=Neisseria lactamica ATCC 23970 TaxID=546265 RepID=D0W8I2_NEILA|nr:hypothetical protein NEILACOT_03836 [Neisseria lactamica ATCC 23970]